MKTTKLKNFSSLLFVLVTITAHTQNVNIPNANFKAALVGNPNINTNMDNEIQFTEAASYADTINVQGLNISDLTGIEAFTILKSLNCRNNQLSNLNLNADTALKILLCENNQLISLDVSACQGLYTLYCTNNQLTNLNLTANAALNYLSCGMNQLTNLDVSSNMDLGILDCYSNQLTNLNISANTSLFTLQCQYNKLVNLDISSNTMLQLFDCDGNQITGLNVSNNPSIGVLQCRNNKLTYLNVKNGNNTSIQIFEANQNPNLTCIQVDDTVFSSANWSNGKDLTASFSDFCPTGIDELTADDSFLIIPNPSNGKFLLQTDNLQSSKIKIFNVIGEIIFQSSDKNLEIDLSKYPKGIYSIEISTKDKSYNKKLIIQ